MNEARSLGHGPGEEVLAIDRAGASVHLGPLRADEERPLFDLFAETVARGDGFPQAAPLTYAAFEEAWLRPTTAVVAARVEGRLVGAYYLKPNFPGRAAHIANAGYLVAPRQRGRGLGRLLVSDSLWRAPLVGFDALQFNLVFASNPARALYRELGFTEVGTIPDAVDGEAAVIYWRRVGPGS